MGTDKYVKTNADVLFFLLAQHAPSATYDEKMVTVKAIEDAFELSPKSTVTAVEGTERKEGE